MRSDSFREVIYVTQEQQRSQYGTACGYVADKIGRLCSGKKDDGSEVKGITERQCVLSGGKGYSGTDSKVVPVDGQGTAYPDTPPPPYSQTG